jgi:hypothetical protein
VPFLLPPGHIPKLLKAPKIHKDAQSLRKYVEKQFSLAKAGKLPKPSRAHFGYASKEVIKQFKYGFLGTNTPDTAQKMEIAKQPDGTERSVRGPEEKTFTGGTKQVNLQGWWRRPLSRAQENWLKGNSFINGHLTYFPGSEDADKRGEESFRRDS